MVLEKLTELPVEEEMRKLQLVDAVAAWSTEILKDCQRKLGGVDQKVLCAQPMRVASMCGVLDNLVHLFSEIAGWTTAYSQARNLRGKERPKPKMSKRIRC